MGAERPAGRRGETARAPVPCPRVRTPLSRALPLPLSRADQPSWRPVAPVGATGQIQSHIRLKTSNDVVPGRQGGRGGGSWQFTVQTSISGLLDLVPTCQQLPCAAPLPRVPLQPPAACGAKDRARVDPAEAARREDRSADPPHPDEPCECEEEDDDGRDDHEDDCPHHQSDHPHNPHDSDDYPHDAHGPDDPDHDADHDHDDYDEYHADRDQDQDCDDHPQEDEDHGDDLDHLPCDQRAQESCGGCAA